MAASNRNPGSSMFHRRLLLLMSGMLVASTIMGAQALWLTTVQGGELLRRAESRLVSERWVPTVRGRILDRKGRVLARDEPSFDILIDYPIITGERAYSDAAALARRENAGRWGRLGRAARERLVQQLLPDRVRKWETMWNELAEALNIDREEIEQRRTRVRRTVQRTATSVWERWLEERREELNRDRELGEEVEVTLADVRRPLAIQRQAHPIARGVREDTGYAVRRLAQRFDGIEVQHAGRRVYPLDVMTVELPRSTFPQPLRTGVGLASRSSTTVEVRGLARHVLGWLRRVQSEDLQRRPRVSPVTGQVDPGLYLAGDLVGARGVEAAYEDRLRGLRGRIVRHLDTGEDKVTSAQPGTDVRLTIDAALQARIQAVMDPAQGLAQVQPWHFSTMIPRDPAHTLPDGTPLYGAAVVLEIDSGDLLALVSTPSFTLEQLQNDPETVFDDPVAAPWVNKAIAKPYPPGSIVKPLLLTYAVTTGAHPLAKFIRCTGYLLPNHPNRFRCWIYKQYNTTHSDALPPDLLGPDGGLGPHVALAVSCNVYFQTLAKELGVSGIIDMYHRFGVGRTFNLGIGEEYPGIAGGNTPEGRLLLSHAILMGIGQGPVAWTPLHAADAYATLARRGMRIAPRLTKDKPPQADELQLDSAALDEVMTGLRDSVNAPWGSGHSLRYPDGSAEPIFTPRPGIEVIGKTGTAQAPPLLGKPDPQTGQRPILRRGDHSWFVVMVGPEGKPPLYVISVIMEYAGSGGRVSGPICNQIIQALIDEGYL